MTLHEFNNSRFGAKDKVIYKDKVYDIISVDFEEGLIGIDEFILGKDIDEINWKRCENCELVKPEIADPNQLSIL